MKPQNTCPTCRFPIVPIPPEKIPKGFTILCNMCLLKNKTASNITVAWRKESK